MRIFWFETTVSFFQYFPNFSFSICLDFKEIDAFGEVFEVEFVEGVGWRLEELTTGEVVKGEAANGAAADIQDVWAWVWIDLDVRALWTEMFIFCSGELTVGDVNPLREGI